jgi:hypothetical protein
MPNIWTTSGDTNLSPELEAARQRIEAEVQAIEACGDENACHLCARREDLTEEHTPSKRAGNPARIVEAAIDYEQTIEQGALAWAVKLVQGGARRRSLCGRCNNSTGSHYNPAYVRLVRRCAPLATPENARRAVAVEVVHPQRVAKQALTTLVATMHPGVTGRFPQLRDLLLDASARGTLAPPLRLGFFLRANQGGRPTGIVASLNRESLAGRLLAEFSFWPLGWVLTFDDVPVEGTTDVSDWLHYGYNERVDLTMGVPCQWAVYSYPADFRSPAEFLLGEGRAFYEKHNQCGSLKAGVNGDRLRMLCSCGASIEQSLDQAPRRA